MAIIHTITHLSSFAFGMLLIGYPHDPQWPGWIAGGVVLTCNIIAASHWVSHQRDTPTPTEPSGKGKTRVGFNLWG